MLEVKVIWERGGNRGVVEWEGRSMEIDFEIAYRLIRAISENLRHAATRVIEVEEKFRHRTKYLVNGWEIAEHEIDAEQAAVSLRLMEPENFVEIEIAQKALHVGKPEEGVPAEARK